MIKISCFDNKYVICGRGQQKYNSDGNKILRKVVASNLAIYNDKSTARNAKSKLVDKVTAQIFNMGMAFVKMTKDGDIWEELSYEDARNKVAHRFRDAARRVNSGEDELPSQSTHFPGSESDGSASVLSSVSFSDKDPVRMPSHEAPTKRNNTTTRGKHHLRVVPISAPSAVFPSSKKKNSIKETFKNNKTLAVASSENVENHNARKLSITELSSIKNELDTLISTSYGNNSLMRKLFYYQQEILFDSPNAGFIDDEMLEQMSGMTFQLDHDGEQDVALAGINPFLETMEELEETLTSCSGFDFDFSALQAAVV